jgi:hypothetical protein
MKRSVQDDMNRPLICGLELQQRSVTDQSHHPVPIGRGYDSAFIMVLLSFCVSENRRGDFTLDLA